jgi:hypothetical protein
LKLQFCAEVPGKNWGQAMWPLAMAGGAGRPNSGGSDEGNGREGCGEEGELTRDRFLAGARAEGRPAAGSRGASLCRPRDPLLRWGRGHAGD